MFTKLSTFLSILTLTSSVTAHGFVNTLLIDGTLYKGNAPTEFDKKVVDSPIRQIRTPEPVKGAKVRDMNCGASAKPATLVAPAMPGSNLTFDWAAFSDDGTQVGFPHNTGPMMTYLASCGNTTCDKFDPIDAQWFKIDQAGRTDHTVTDHNEGDWVLGQSLFANKTYSLSLPTNLPPGQYLVRHEILALHNANIVKKAEFYPSCTQLRVGGNGNGSLPTGNDTVVFPGAYDDKDPGILIHTQFNVGAPYTFPGPNVTTAFASPGHSVTAAIKDIKTTLSSATPADNAAIPSGATNATTPANGTVAAVAGSQPCSSDKPAGQRRSRPYVRSRIMRGFPTSDY